MRLVKIGKVCKPIFKIIGDNKRNQTCTDLLNLKTDYNICKTQYQWWLLCKSQIFLFKKQKTKHET